MFSRGFMGSAPVDLVQAAIRSLDLPSWREIYVACSGTFRTERMILKAHPGVVVRSNDVSLMSCALGRLATGDPLPFTFRGDLAFVEELGLTDARDRVAAVIVALNVSGYATGKPNRFKTLHWDHHRDRFPAYVAQVRKKVDTFLSDCRIASFHGCDWLDHVDAAVAAGAGVMAFPPTLKGGYEKMFEFLSANVDWEPPAYRIFDPQDLAGIIDRLAASAAPYFLYCDQKIPGHKPMLEIDRNGYHRIYGYARSGKPVYLASSPGGGEAFAYTPLDVTKIGPKTQVDIVPVSGAKITFLKNVYLKKTIRHTSGQANFLVLLDGMLAGGLTYSLSKFGAHDALFLLSDFSTTRLARIAKLVARVATNRAVVRHLEKRFLERYSTLATAVFSDNPVSMKYRGTFDLQKREERDALEGKYMLYYTSSVRDEPLSDAFKWWWNAHGKREVAEARNGAAPDRPEETPAA